MSRCTVIAALAALVTAVPTGTASSVVATELPSSAAAVQPCGGSSWVAGSANICRGTLTYRDYVYDDYGADTGDPNAPKSGNLTPPAGDQRYPEGAVNTADLVQLKLWVKGGRLHVRGLLNTLFKPRSTVLAVAIDTDGDRRTGGGQWGGLRVSSRGWDVLYRFDRGNPESNVIAGSVPMPDGKTWRVQAVTAQRSSGTVMNVAFRGVNERADFTMLPNAASPYPPSGQGLWWDDHQAAALRAGDITRFGRTLAVADLIRHRTRLTPVGPGLHQRVYTSDYTLPPGEGFSYQGVPGRGDGGQAPVATQNFTALGRYQPYGIYLPKRGGPYGMQMVFHGSNSGHAALINQPGMQRQFGEELRRVLVVPLARGDDGYGSDISERDLLDVMADVQRAYPVDRDRVFAGGYSQGGYITFRMSMLYPDRFAGFVGWVPFGGDAANGTPARGTISGTAGAVGNMIDYVGNARHVPGTMIYGGADYLVHVWTAVAMEREFAAHDSAYKWRLHPAAEHLIFAGLDEWAQEAAYTKDLRLVRNPPRVTYRTDPILDAPRYGIRHDKAYWVAKIRTAKAGPGEVDLTTRACGGRVPVSEHGQGAGPDPVPYVMTFRRTIGSKELPRAAKLSGTLDNVRSLRIDASATCLARKAFRYDITSTGPATITLSDDRKLRLPAAGRHAGLLPAR